MTSVILFDIDKTLLNTQKLMSKYILPALGTYCNLTFNAFEDLSQRYWKRLSKSTAFDPEAYFEYLSRHVERTPEELKTVFFNPEFFENSMYEEVVPTLDELVNKEYNLGIFSEGKAQYQLAKLKLTELAPYFDPDLLFISNDKVTPEFMATLPIDAMVVEDKPEVVAALRQQARCQPLWLNRLSNDKDPHVKTIHSLSEILELI